VYASSENARRFFLYSRRGLLPKVRGKIGKHQNKFLNRENLDCLLAANRHQLTLQAIFKLLNQELENAYGQPIDWNEVLNPSGQPADLLQRYLEDAIHGDGPQGELIWQTILHQSFDMVQDIYLNLSLDERMRFDSEYTSAFFTHAATQPIINAEKMLALMKAGMVDVIKLGPDYRLIRDEIKDCYEFIYRDGRGNLKKDAYRYVVDARGQAKSLEANPSIFIQNLITSGTVLIEEIRPLDPITHSFQDIAGESATADNAYRTGSIWIDPATYHIMQRGPQDYITRSETIYAVGAMTRGQIITASMVRGIVQATSKIAEDLVNYLTKTAKK
jgi:hypothetical protein